MAKQDCFSLYDATSPARVRIFCSPKFRGQAAATFHAHHPHAIAWFADFNELVQRLAAGRRVSVDSFRQEGPGYAFRCGRLRFYGVYSSRHAGCFILSHVIFKKGQKLAEADIAKMQACLCDFEALSQPPEV